MAEKNKPQMAQITQIGFFICDICVIVVKNKILLLGFRALKS